MMESTQPKKVLYILDCLYANAGGGSEQQFLKLYSRCEQTGVDPYVVFLREKEVHHRIEWAREPVVLGIPSFKSPALFVGLLKLLRFIRRERIRVLHTLFDDASMLGAVIKLLAPGVTLIASQRNLGYAHKGVRRQLIAVAFRLADYVVVNASVIANWLISDYRTPGHKITVIRNFYVEPPIYPPERVRACLAEIRQQHDVVVVVVANLRAVKGIDELLSAALLTRESASIGYVILGDGGGLDDYRKRVRELGLEGTVHLFGYQHDVTCYLQAADVAVLPSRSEGLSNALVEYMFAGLPIVATDVGGNREALDNGECGELVSPRNPRALADGILGLVKQPKLRKLLGEKARASAQRRFNLDAVTRSYRELYEKA
jgi:glycosyltransferase involved in cell wall biosynthesis